MPARRTVRVLHRPTKWDFGGRLRFPDDMGDPVAHPDDLKRCTATDLKFSLRQARTEFGCLWISDRVGPDIDVEDAPDRSPVSFPLRGDDLVMRLTHEMNEDYLYGPIELRERVERALAPLLARNRTWLVSAAESDSLQPKVGWWFIAVDLGFHCHGRLLGDLFAVGLDALALLNAIDSGDFGREQIADLLRSGHAKALIGRAENEWLEAKRQHYDLASTVGKIKLAQAVARFANAEHGGLVVFGLATKSDGTCDVIRKVTPVPHDRQTVRRYRSVLNSRLFPFPADLSVEAIPDSSGTGDLILINVPPQPEELKPFLVHGAVIGGEADECFISIVRRSGDSSVPTSPAAIHATLAIGRALLRDHRKGN